MPSGWKRPSSLEDDRVVGEIVAKHSSKLPEGVKRIDYEFGEDWSGDPAVHVWLVVDSEFEPLRDQISALDRLADGLRSEIIEARTDHWPYVRIRVDE